jgi:hypothetical protein
MFLAEFALRPGQTLCAAAAGLLSGDADQERPVDPVLIFYGPILFGDLMSYDGGLDAIWSSVRAVLR